MKENESRKRGGEDRETKKRHISHLTRAALGVFVQQYDTGALDASLLLMPPVRFVSPTNPVWLSTLRAHQALTNAAMNLNYQLDHGAGRMSLDELVDQGVAR